MVKKINFVLTFLVFVTFLGVNAVHAEDTTIYPTLPGTSVRDYSKPGLKIEGNEAYPTLPGTNIRDFSKPGLRIEGDKVYPTLPGTNIRDYSKPGYKIEWNNQIYKLCAPQDGSYIGH